MTQLKTLLFEDPEFINTVIKENIDNIFLWLDRKSEQLIFTMDRQTAKDKYLTFAYSKLEEGIVKELGHTVDLSKVPQCKEQDLSVEELKIRFLNDKPCLPFDLSGGVDTYFTQMGLVNNGKDLIISQVPEDKLQDFETFRDVYTIVNNSILLSLAFTILLVTLITLLTPNIRMGYILSGVCIFIPATINTVVFSFMKTVDIDTILTLAKVEEGKIPKEVIEQAYDLILSDIIMDIFRYAKIASIYFLAAPILILISLIVINSIQKRKLKNSLSTS